MNPESQDHRVLQRPGQETPIPSSLPASRYWRYAPHGHCDATVITKEVGKIFSAALLGDLNHDGTVNAVDIDLLRLAINPGSTDPIYDVNGGGLDGTDFNYEVETIIGSGFGDADLNQQMNFTDFVSMSNNFGSSGTGWAQGNFNLDNITNFADFVLLANNYGTDLSSGVLVQETVPEPTSVVLLSLAVGFVAKRPA